MVDYELNELKKEFLGEAREKVDEMASALDAGGTPSLERLAYLAHQLKGSGGSYGYQQISEHAAALEKAIEAMGNGTRLNPDELRRYVESLRSEIERGTGELG